MPLLPEDQRRRRTCRSIANERKLDAFVKGHDARLTFHFSPSEGFYYVSRKILCSDDQVASVCLQGLDTVFAESLARHEVVVCYPIPVEWVEDEDRCRKNLAEFFKKNDTYRYGTTREERIKNMEYEMDYNRQKKLDAHRKFCREMRGARAREYWDEHIAPREFFSGIPGHSPTRHDKVG